MATVLTVDDSPSIRQMSKVTLEDEESCVVFGMPREAIALGAVEKVVSLTQIPREIMLWHQAGHAAMAD